MKRIKYIFKLSRYIKQYRLKLLISILIHALYKFMPICLGFETSFVLSMVLTGNTFDPKLHFTIVLVMIVLTAILNYLDVFVSHDVAYRILTELRSHSYEKIREIAPSGLQDENSGNIMSIVLEDIEILEWFYAHSIIQVFLAVVLPLITLIVIGSFSLWISLIISFFIILMCIIPYLSRKDSDRQGKQVQENLGKLNSVIIDGIQGLKDIITFQWQGIYFKRFFNTNDRYNEAVYRYQKRSVSEISSINLIIGLSSFVSSVSIVFFCKTGNYSNVWILPLISISTLIYIPLQETLSMSSNYGRIFAAAKRVFDFLQVEPSIKDLGKVSHKEVQSEDKRNIEFRNVEFRYPNKDSKENIKVLKNISFKVNENETVVLVGKSGCGKSTCIKLLQRFWDVDSGEILLNGIDIRDISLKSLRKLITVVPQNVYLFNRSIEDNLKLGKEDADKHEIKSALKNANAYDFVSGLSDGVETYVGENGMKLSGGEKQRISIAQAFLKNSPILLLDEISSNLDYDNEKIVNEALKRLKKDKITLMIAHRPSTIKSADKIIFIKDGNCNDEGTYEELIKRNYDFRNTVEGFS